MTKALQLLTVLSQSPKEFFTRALAIATSRWETPAERKVDYRTASFEAACQSISASVNSDCARFLEEPCLASIESEVEKLRHSLLSNGPFAAFHNGDSALARLCYTLTRILRPNFIVETGVCYGVTSAYTLKALQVNSEGLLHSIDLPPLGKNGDDYVGWLVPQELRGRWRLHRGTSNRLLRPLLAELGQIDIFIHDSLHTYRNMRNEFALAWPALRPGGVLISDDIEGNKAFQELCELPGVAVSVVVKEENKDSLLGVAVKKR